MAGKGSLWGWIGRSVSWEDVARQAPRIVKVQRLQENETQQASLVNEMAKEFERVVQSLDALAPASGSSPGWPAVRWRWPWPP